MRFFKEKITDEQTEESFIRMMTQIKARGGNLNFVITIDKKEGWFAVCKEFPSIISGGKNTNPSEDEISRSIIEAVKTAFHVPIKELRTEEENSGVKITLQREVCFA